MTIPAEATRPDNGFIDALHVSTARPVSTPCKLMLFGPSVGSWDLGWQPALTASLPPRPANCTFLDRLTAWTTALP